MSWVHYCFSCDVYTFLYAVGAPSHCVLPSRGGSPELFGQKPKGLLQPQIQVRRNERTSVVVVMFTKWFLLVCVGLSTGRGMLWTRALVKRSKKLETFAQCSNLECQCFGLLLLLWMLDSAFKSVENYESSVRGWAKTPVRPQQRD